MSPPPCTLARSLASWLRYWVEYSSNLPFRLRPSLLTRRCTRHQWLSRVSLADAFVLSPFFHRFSTAPTPFHSFFLPLVGVYPPTPNPPGHSIRRDLVRERHFSLLKQKFGNVVYTRAAAAVTILCNVTGSSCKFTTSLFPLSILESRVCSA